MSQSIYFFQNKRGACVITEGEFFKMCQLRFML